MFDEEGREEFIILPFGKKKDVGETNAQRTKRPPMPDFSEKKVVADNNKLFIPFNGRGAVKGVTSYVYGQGKSDPKFKESQRKSYRPYETYQKRNGENRDNAYARTENAKMKKLGIETEEEYLRFKTGGPFNLYMEKKGQTTEDALYPYGQPSEEKKAYLRELRKQMNKTYSDIDYRRKTKKEVRRPTNEEVALLYDESKLRDYVIRRYGLHDPDALETEKYFIGKVRSTSEYHERIKALREKLGAGHMDLYDPEE
jgi:hypothetical protein